ncbi:unnamed protein product [Paramecium sonneborni]|uniref:Uncharacterized protein n=1 Tax=Paramecium sonneborni TaxID=65129 RepID=A0A8S1NLN4_9CILI|nr:unnamed protein product [Paramecium sonneborni]
MSKKENQVSQENGFRNLKILLIIPRFIYDGEYNQQGQKIGRWNIYWNWGGSKNKLGGGLYEEQKGCSIKIGKWIEESDNFGYFSQITQSGEYNKIGQKIGTWNLFFMDEEENKQMHIINYNKKGKKIGRWDIQYKGNKIGGGQYDEQEQYERKIGKWIELSDGFYFDSQIIYIGEYNDDGTKIGRWDIMYQWEKDYQKIGRGLYFDFEDIFTKTGIWIELGDLFCYSSQIIYNGNQNKKVQKNEGSIKKIGKWIEQWEKYAYSREITYYGEYNKDGKKVGIWNIGYNGQIIGGGSYDQQEGGSIKKGIWIEQWDGFEKDSQVTYQGKYNQNGKKMGNWDIMYRESDEFKQIGGGQYTEQDGCTKKIGKWVELGQNFGKEYQLSQRIFVGDYNEKGKKVDRSVEMDFWSNEIVQEINYDN